MLCFVLYLKPTQSVHDEWAEFIFLFMIENVNRLRKAEILIYMIRKYV